MKKHLPTIVFLFAFLTFMSYASADDALKPFSALVERYKQFQAAGNVDGLMSLVCWDHASQEIKNQYREDFKEECKQKLTKITIQHPDSESNKEQISDGVAYHPNLKVIQQMVVTFQQPPDGGLAGSMYSLGQKGDAVFIVIPVPSSK